MEIKNLKINLEKNKKSILEKILENNGQDVSIWSIERWVKEVLLIIPFSFSSIIDDFILENTDFFSKYILKSVQIEEYIDNVIKSDFNTAPFSHGQPTDFFNSMNEFAETLYKKYNNR